jgi:hypothetical protein
MSDLVKRLREAAQDDRVHTQWQCELSYAAADRIEELERAAAPAAPAIWGRRYKNISELMRLWKNAEMSSDEISAELFRHFSSEPNTQAAPAFLSDTGANGEPVYRPKGAAPSEAQPVAWISVHDHLPDYCEDRRVLCYTPDHDYGGTHFITLKAEDFYALDPDDPDDPGTQESKTVSHWMWEDDAVRSVYTHPAASAERVLMVRWNEHFTWLEATDGEKAGERRQGYEYRWFTPGEKA